MALAPAARKSDVRVLLISDHTIVRAGIRSLIEKQPGMTVVGEVRSCVEDLENIQERPDVILIDLDSGSDDYLESVVQTMQPAHALALTSSHDDPAVWDRSDADPRALQILDDGDRRAPTVGSITNGFDGTTM